MPRVLDSPDGPLLILAAYFSELALPAGQLASTFPLRVRVTDHCHYLPLSCNEPGSIVKASTARAERGDTGLLQELGPGLLETCFLGLNPGLVLFC